MPIALDDHTADRLLRGLVAPDDAPPGYAPVAALLQDAASSPVTFDDRHVWAMTSTIRGMQPSAAPRPAGARRRGKRLSAVAAASVAVALLGAPTVAARVGAPFDGRPTTTVNDTDANPNDAGVTLILPILPPDPAPAASRPEQVPAALGVAVSPLDLTTIDEWLAGVGAPHDPVVPVPASDAPPASEPVPATVEGSDADREELPAGDDTCERGPAASALDRCRGSARSTPIGPLRP